MKIVHLLNQSRDVPLAVLLEKTCPVPMQTYIVNLEANDEFAWKKPKKLEKCMQDSDIEAAKLALPKAEEVTNLPRLKEILGSTDICLSRGREFFIFLSKAKKNIAMCFNRCYFSRLLDVLPKYSGRLKVMMFHENWLDEGLCGRFEMSGRHTYDMIRDYREHFIFGTPFPYIYNYLKDVGKEAIRKKLGIPEGRPFAFVSFRAAEKAFSVHENYDVYMENAKKTLTAYKEQGYYIVIRRRLGKHDLIGYKVLGMPDKARFNEVSGLFDVEMNQTSRFPGEIYECMFAADIHVLMDVSGIAYVEAAQMHCPIYMPHSGSMPRIGDVCPAIRDMFNSGLMQNKDTSETREIYRRDISKFLDKWYRGSTEDFWREVLK